MSRPIRIAGASGSASDRRHAIASLAKNHPTDPIDVIICDHLSEANMVSTAAKRQAGTSAPAYETPFLEALEPALLDLAQYGIKVVTNAGASDAEGLTQAVERMIAKAGLSISVARVSGDEVLPRIQSHLATGQHGYHDIYTSESLSTWSQQYKPIFAQAYLGGQGITRALVEGAQIVICGRVSDASPVIGAAVWWHRWALQSFDLLANALIAGHLIECSTYVTGGNFSGFREVEKYGWKDLGFPIAEIASDGQVMITKQRGAGGCVTVDTCTSQLLYEIQGPYYLNSDVTAHITDIWFEQISIDRVAMYGIKGLPPPPTTKVGITALAGYQAEAWWFLTGLHISDKARMLEAQLRHNLAPYSASFTTLRFSTIGTPAADADNQDAATVMFRVFAQARTVSALAPKKFLRPIMDNIMQGYPGATFHLDFRQGLPKPFYEYFVTLLPQTEIDHRTHIRGQELVIPPPENTLLIDADADAETETDTDGPSTVPTSNSPSQPYGPTLSLPLGTIIHARSGDKSHTCNCGFWTADPKAYPWLLSLLTTPKIHSLLLPSNPSSLPSDSPALRISRFALPNLRAVHFLFRGWLGRGVTATSGLDFLGKNCAEFLRARVVEIPVRFLSAAEKGKL